MNLNDQNLASTGFYMDKLVITDAEDLKDVDTACYISKNGTVLPLDHHFNSTSNLLTLSAQDG